MDKRTQDHEPADGRARDGLASDIANMLDYCRSNGIPVLPASEPPRGDGSAAGRAPSSDSPPAIDSPITPALHAQLSAAIRPATPRTLAATAFSLRPLRMGAAALLVIVLAAVALAAVVGYSTTLAGAARGTLGWVVQVNYLCAALLGAAFSALFTASPYIRDRTFDPRYVLVYVLRMVLGVIAGLILANLGGGLFRSDALIAKLGTGIIGLLGGYSAEAVRSILDRLVEVLVAAVEGKDKTKLKEKELELSADLLDVAQIAAADPQTPQAVRDTLDRLLKKLRK